MLCERCQELIASSVELSDRDSFPHHTCIEDFRISVDARCMICATIWFEYTPDEQQKLNQLEGYEYETFGLINVYVVPDYELEEIRFDFELGPGATETTGISRRIIEFIVLKEVNESQEAIYSRLALDSLQLSGTTDSNKTFSLASRWIDECIAKHPACNHSTDTEWHPTRLLSLGHSLENEESLVYLVESNDVTPSGPYMTLSHSWGRGHMMTLNKQSYHSLLQGIPLSSLPPTFRDACSIARQLGVQYLWIDALCIFQDKGDLSDWSREASLMNKVYSYSYCNIVAADNRDSSQPIFRKRDPKSLNPPTTETLVQKGHSQRHTDESVSPGKYVIDYLGYLTPVKDAHINTRGWVMQERLLSPRALHFGEHQVYWECSERRASETNPDGLEIYGDGVPFKGLVKGPHVVFSWTQLVMAYSRCALSYPSDKLVAFSAIARSYATHLSDEYAAGMWRSRLHNDLLWLVLRTAKSDHTRYGTYTAPTWSWASINGMVWIPFESDGVEYQYKVDGYKLEYVTEDKMGAIRSGWLCLSGQLRPLKLLRRTTNEFASEEENIIWSLVIDSVEYDPRHYVAEQAGGLPFSVVHLDESHVDFGTENESGSLYCMLATHHLFNEVGERCNMWDFFLFQLVDATQGTFCRIGLARTRTGDVDKPYPAGELVHGPSVQPSLLPCAAYKDGIHSIYII